MVPLRTNRRVLTWLCVYPMDPNISKWWKLVYIIFTLSVLGTNLSSVGASVVFFLKYVKIDVEESLFAIVQIIGIMSMVYVMAITFFLRHEITALLDDLTKIYEMHTNEETMQFLKQADETSEFMWKIFFEIVIIGESIFYTTIILMSMLFRWFIDGKFVSKYSYRAFRLVLPWNQNSVHGYISETIYGVISCDTYLICGSFVLLFISLCQHHRAFYKMVQFSLRRIGHSNNDQQDRVLLCKLIYFHIYIKNFFGRSSKVFGLFLMVQLVCAMLMLSGAVVHLDLQMRHIDFRLSIVIMVLIASVSILYLYCFFGKFATESYEKIGDSIYASDWQNLSTELQKYFILMIGNAQRPQYYSGFGLVVVNLETFTKLLKTVYTFYMMFKTLTSND